MTTIVHHTSIDDADLRADVEDELIWDPAVPSTNVGISVTDHTVTLSGSVRSLSERFAAVRAAERVKGVHALVDEIVVAGAPGSEGSDEEVARAVEHVLESSSIVPSTVKATVRDGVVTLAGSVEFQYQRDAASRTVRDVKGVTVMHNDITVKGKASESVVRSKIVASMHRNAQLDAKDIHVHTAGHEVWLSGTTRSFAARRQAESAAWSAPGVEHVHNNIVVN
jgi:osmotically-inducible protein OsmY